MKRIILVAAVLAALFPFPFLSSATLAAGDAAPSAAEGATPPRPWETAVRLRRTMGAASELGSGTVIGSNAERSIILTCAHLFTDEPGRGSVTADLFHPDLTMPTDKPGPGVLRYRETVSAVLLLADPVLDVAIVEIRPGRILHASPVVPKGYQLAAGQALTAVGCGNGQDARVWSTVVVSANKADGSGYRYTECASRPRQGRSGGGLFDLSGQLVGVCDFAVRNEDRGLYAAPDSIHSIMERTGLIFGGRPSSSCPPGTVCPYPTPMARAPRPEPSYRATPSPQTPPPSMAAIPATPPSPPSADARIAAYISDLAVQVDDQLPEGSHLFGFIGGVAALLFGNRARAARVA